MRPSYKKPYYYIHNVNTSVGKSSNNVSNLNPTNIQIKVNILDYFVYIYI